MAGFRIVAAFGADDSGRDRGLETERRADRYRPFTHLHGIRVPDFDGNQRLTRVDFDHGQVHLGVRANHFGGVFGCVAMQLHSHAGGAVHNVVVGQDIAVLVHDEARAGALGTPRLLRHLAEGLAAEEAPEQIRAVLAEGLHVLRGTSSNLLLLNGAGDLHHRGLELFGESRKLVGKLHGVWNDQWRGIRRRTGGARGSNARVNQDAQQQTHGHGQGRDRAATSQNAHFAPPMSGLTRSSRRWSRLDPKDGHPAPHLRSLSGIDHVRTLLDQHGSRLGPSHSSRPHHWRGRFRVGHGDHRNRLGLPGQRGNGRFRHRDRSQVRRPQRGHRQQARSHQNADL